MTFLRRGRVSYAIYLSITYKYAATTPNVSAVLIMKIVGFQMAIISTTIKAVKKIPNKICKDSCVFIYLIIFSRKLFR